MNRAAGVVSVLLLGMAACGSGSATESPTLPTSSLPATDDPAPASSSSAPTTTTSSTSPEPTTESTVLPIDGAPWDLTFGDVDGLIAVDNPKTIEISPFDETTTAWAASGGITEGFVALVDVPVGPAPSPEGDVSAERFDAPSGEAWLVTDNVEDDSAPSSTTRVMWWRDNGRVWITFNRGVTPEELVEFVLAVDVEPDGSYTVNDASWTPVGPSTSREYRSMSQQWELDGYGATLMVTNGGLARQLSDLSAREIEERTVAGQRGYAVTLASGQVNLFWPTDHPDWWMTLTAHPALANRIDELADALTPTSDSPNSESGDSTDSVSAIVAAFCVEFASLGGEQPESYVGSADHVAAIEGLLEVSPDSVAADVAIFRDYLSSGAIDSESDPESNLTENWPDEVQTAIATTQTFAAENC